MARNKTRQSALCYGTRSSRWPGKLHADKGYDFARCRVRLKRFGIKDRIDIHVALLSLACCVICIRRLESFCAPL